jgi:hypothetical protein
MSGTTPVGRPTDPYREWDAAYVLGALSPADRRAFEAHLAGCAACREAVSELAGIPGLLSTLPPAEATGLLDDAVPDAAGADVVPVAALAAAARRSRARRRALAAVAASALVVGGVLAGASLDVGLGGGRSGTGSGEPSAAPSSGTAAEPVPGQVALDLEPVGAVDVHATLTATPQEWGTRLEWSCSYPATGGYDAPRPVAYELVLVDRAGARTVVATWTASGTESTGLGAASALPLSEVERVEIAVDGRALAAAEL